MCACLSSVCEFICLDLCACVFVCVCVCFWLELFIHVPVGCSVVRRVNSGPC